MATDVKPVPLRSRGIAKKAAEVPKVLLVEDEERDAELVLRQLKRAGLACESRRVQSELELRRSLLEFRPDIVLSDFSMPGFNGMEALRICRELDSDLPFIFISGTVGEDVAVEAVKGGANDYVMKASLARLGSAVQRELREAAARKLHAEARLAAEQALRESEAGLRHAQRIARLAHVVVRMDGSYESASASMAELLGSSPGEAPRGLEDYLRYVHPEDLERVRETVRDAVRSREAYTIEYRIVRTDGRVVHIRQEAEWLANADGSEPTRRFATIQDVTERRSAEEKEREAGQLLDNIVDNIPTAVQLKSVQDEFRIVMWNKAAEAIYGLPREQAIGRNVHDLWPQADADRFHAADLELAKGGGMQDFPDRGAQTKHRGEVRMHMRKVALFDASGKATHLLAIADDITSQLADQARLRESEERFRSLSMLSSDWFWEQDTEHRFVKFSGGEGVKGWGPDQSKAIGLHRWDLGGVTPISCSWEEHRRLLDAHKPFRNFEYLRILGDGRLQYVEASGEPIFDGAGGFTGYRGVATEITQRKEAENRIRRLNRVYAVLSGINSLIVRARDRAELFAEACRVVVEKGRFPMAWIGAAADSEMQFEPVAWAGDAQEYLARMPQALRENGGSRPGLIQMMLRDKQAVIVNDVANDPRMVTTDDALEHGFRSLVVLPLMVDGRVDGILNIYAEQIGFFDEEEMRLLNELAGDIAFALEHIAKTKKLDYLAYYDELTALANRTLFVERLGQKMRDAGGSKRMLAVWFVDIERFKAVNDALGRQNGDLLLQQIAARMKAAGKDETRMARIGADHFAVVSDQAQNESDIARLTEQRLQQVFDAPFKVAGQDVRASARFGIAMFPQDGGEAEALLRNAEAAVKKAKAAGEPYVFYKQKMTERVAGKLALENKLRLAIEKEEFVLHYQPKVGLQGGQIVGVEALIRWQSPEKGLVPPLQFIPLLEEIGLILQVGAWALKRAALDHRAWIESGFQAPRVAVNVSAIQLRQRDFVWQVEEAIMGGVVPTAIDLELTESLLMEDIKGNIEKLKAVRDLGVTIAIDDFGTGYSSLGYLAQLPVHALKIDRSFVIRMQEDPDAMTLVSTMITLAHSLRLKVIAEGVETEEQARFLRLLRCDQMQGYLFSKPLPLPEMTALLRARDKPSLALKRRL